MASTTSQEMQDGRLSETDPRNAVVNSPGAFTHLLQPRGHACHGILKTVTVTSNVVFIILGTTDCDNIRITFRRKNTEEGKCHLLDLPLMAEFHFSHN